MLYRRVGDRYALGTRGGKGLKKNIAFRTNLLVCILLIVSSIVISVFSYDSSYKLAKKNVEQLSEQTSKSVYYQITNCFSEPIAVARTMAGDTLLVECLQQEASLSQEQMAENIGAYLSAYQQMYGFDAVFLVSTETGRYYNCNGIDRIVSQSEEGYAWYDQLLASDRTYAVDVDNDKSEGADDAQTFFVDCKMTDAQGNVVGVVGVGILMDELKESIDACIDGVNGQVFLVDQYGKIQFSNEEKTVGDEEDTELPETGGQQPADVQSQPEGQMTAEEQPTAGGQPADVQSQPEGQAQPDTEQDTERDFFKENDMEDLREPLMQHGENGAPQRMWRENGMPSEARYMESQFIEELSWNLIVSNDIGSDMRSVAVQILKSSIVIFAVVIVILLVITRVVRRFEKRITELTKEQEQMIRKATRDLYGDICEWNLSSGMLVNESAESVAKALGVDTQISYETVIGEIAKRYVNETEREEFLTFLDKKNLLAEFEYGDSCLHHEFQIQRESGQTLWMRIDAYISYHVQENAYYLLTYWKNIDAQKRKEIDTLNRAERDEMTGLYTKTSIGRHITKYLAANETQMGGFFIFDIDNFKQANDGNGHAFGDAAITEFAGTIRDCFPENSLIGRIGGDEFVAFMPATDWSEVETQAKKVSGALERTVVMDRKQWNMSASIGVAMSPTDGTTYEMLYRNADKALYRTKKNGKNGFNVYDASSDVSTTDK